MKNLKTSTLVLGVLGSALTLTAVPSIAAPKAQAKASRSVAPVSKPIVLTEQEMAQTTGTLFSIGPARGVSGRDFGQFVSDVGPEIRDRVGGAAFGQRIAGIAQTNEPNGPPQ